MAEKLLDYKSGDIGFEKVGGERMAEHVDAAMFFNLGQYFGISEHALDGTPVVGLFEFGLEEEAIGFKSLPVYA